MIASFQILSNSSSHSSALYSLVTDRAAKNSQEKSFLKSGSWFKLIYWCTKTTIIITTRIMGSLMSVWHGFLLFSEPWPPNMHSHLPFIVIMYLSTKNRFEYVISSSIELNIYKYIFHATKYVYLVLKFKAEEECNEYSCRIALEISASALWNIINDLKPEWLTVC
jgi:hypothetical protein